MLLVSWLLEFGVLRQARAFPRKRMTQCVAWAGVGRRQAGMIAVACSLSALWPFWCHTERKALGMTSQAAFSPAAASCEGE